MPLTQKSMKAVNFYLNLQLKKDYGRGAIVSKKKAGSARFSNKILRLG